MLPTSTYTEQRDRNPIAVFRYALRAPESRRQYPRRFKLFLDYLTLDGELGEQANQFYLRARQDHDWAEVVLMEFIAYQKERVRKGEISNSTIPNYYRATKLFCEMNDIILNWKKIARGLPRAGKAANDRAPTVEEIRKLIEYPDRRIKPIVFTMISSGIRIGAWDYLRWKDVIPLRNNEDEIVAAKLVVYSGDSEEYYSFITPSAYASLKDWMDFRSSYGEKITGDSWIMRDIWQTTNIDYGAKLGLATFPRKLKSSGIKRLLERALWEQGLRHKLGKGERRHEWKAAHGFRKFYKTHAEQVMRPINVEITMGHNIGVSASYYRPTEREVLEDFLKAVDLLSINYHEQILRKQIDDLTSKTQDNEYAINAKLREKDDALVTLSDQVMKLMAEVQELKKQRL
ncbi:MAG: hypothetical protein WBX01_01540 [Nitrososphaeraceae archaeon]